MDIKLSKMRSRVIATQQKDDGDVLLMEVYQADIVRIVEMTPSEAAALAQALWTDAGLEPISLGKMKLRGLVFIEDDGTIRAPSSRDI